MLAAVFRRGGWWHRQTSYKQADREQILWTRTTMWLEEEELLPGSRSDLIIRERILNRILVAVVVDMALPIRYDGAGKIR